MIKPRILTHTRRLINPLDLSPDDVAIDDIAHHLSTFPRFVGATDFPISVGAHSLYVSYIVQYRLEHDLGKNDRRTLLHTALCALQGLLHDGSEAYLGDVTKWLKSTPEMEGYRLAEDRAQAVIFHAFGVPLEQHEVVDWADRVMVRWEGLHGFGLDWKVNGPDGTSDHPMYPPLTEEERTWLRRVPVELDASWRRTRFLFKERFTLLNETVETLRFHA